MAKFINKGIFITKDYLEDSSKWDIAELTRDEYTHLKTEYLNLNSEYLLAIETNKTLNNKIIILQKELNENSQNLHKLEDFNNINSKQLLNLQDQINILEKQNNNLLRINREKSNSIRNLIPKKKHIGYIKKNSQEFIYLFNYSENINCVTRKYQKKLLVWKTLVQTPFSLDFEQKDLDVFIANDFKKLNLEMVDINKFKELDQLIKFINSKEQFIFDLKLKENLIEKFWEISFLSKSRVEI